MPLSSTPDRDLGEGPFCQSQDENEEPLSDELDDQLLPLSLQLEDEQEEMEDVSTLGWLCSTVPITMPIAKSGPLSRS
jgi:hypothetical protein